MEVHDARFEQLPRALVIKRIKALIVHHVSWIMHPSQKLIVGDILRPAGGGPKQLSNRKADNRAGNTQVRSVVQFSVVLNKESESVPTSKFVKASVVKALPKYVRYEWRSGGCFSWLAPALMRCLNHIVAEGMTTSLTL